MYPESWKLVVGQNDNLRELHLDECELDDLQGVSLLNVLKHWTSLTELSLSYNSLGKDSTKALCSFINTSRVLKTLAVPGNKDLDRTCIIRAVKHNNILRKLDLSSWWNVRKDIVGLAALLMQNKTLEVLDCSGASYPSVLRVLDSPEDIKLAVQTNTTLVHLNLSCCGLNSESGIALGVALQTNRVLQFLGLSDNELQDIGFTAVANGVSQNPSLKFLLLGNNMTTPIAMEHFPELLESDKLVYLDVGDNSCGSPGCKAIEQMKCNGTLVSLAMQDCFFESAEAFQRMISLPFPFLGLKELILRQFAYNNKYAKGVFHWILRSPSLEVLDMQSAFMNSKRILDDTEAVQELCQALSTNETLKTLDLDYCGTPDMNATLLLAKMLAQNTSIEYFAMTNQEDEMDLSRMRILLAAFEAGGNQQVRTLRLGAVSVLAPTGQGALQV